MSPNPQLRANKNIGRANIPTLVISLTHFKISGSIGSVFTKLRNAWQFLCQIKATYQTENKLWYDILCERISLELRSDTLLHHKQIMNPILLKIQKSIQNFFTSTLKIKLTSESASIRGDDGSILSNPKNICQNSIFGFIPSSNRKTCLTCLNFLYATFHRA